MEASSLVPWLAWPMLAAPAASLVAYGGALLFGIRPPEWVAVRLAGLASGIGLVCALSTGMLLTRTGGEASIVFGQWLTLPDFDLTLKIHLDAFSLTFAGLSALLCSVIGAFAGRYLHREPGFARFHLMFLLFQLGMASAALAGNIETLFAGWELVGLSSAMLVAFFHERPAPSRNGFRIWSVYRISDAALLAAAVAMHHVGGHGDFDQLLRLEPGSTIHHMLTPFQSFYIGSLLLVAAAGKSGLVPFSGWLPRAMEGPTPSSAVFYGALSIHLGAFLLLRVEPVLEQSPALRAAIIALGLLTALTASLTGRVQSDIKGILSYASLTQVGLIVAEIGFGLRWLALAHLVGHACLRTLQFLRAPNLLHDRHLLENAVGGRLHQTPWLPGLQLAPEARHWWYRIAIDRGGFDSLLHRAFVAPLQRTLQACDQVERRWTDWLSGGKAARLSDSDSHHTGGMEEMA
jgi:NADH-quinone oxidoreductase subunit L